MNRCAFFIPLLFIVFQACTPKSSDGPTNRFEYDPIERSLPDQARFRVGKVSCIADSLGKISIQLELTNATRETITLTPQDFELETKTGLRSAPVSPVDSVIIMPAQAVNVITLIFEPTNSLRLLHYTGLKGDLGRWYRFVLPRGEGSFKFQLPEGGYAAYKNSRKEIRVFALGFPAEFETNQLSYLRDTAGFQENGVALHEEEMLVNGLNLALAAYTYNDTLVLKVRMVNHSLFPVSVKLSALVVRQAEKLNFPQPVNPDSVVIPRSQRAHVELHYPLFGRTIKQFSLAVSTICFLTPKPVPVFYTDIISMKHIVLSDQ